MSPTMMSKKRLSIILSLLVSLPSKVCGFYFTIKELSRELLSVGGCPHGLVNVGIITKALRFNRGGKFPGILLNRTNKIRFYKIVISELLMPSSVSPNSQFKQNRPRMIPGYFLSENNTTRDLVHQLQSLGEIMAGFTQEEVATIQQTVAAISNTETPEDPTTSVGY